MMLNFEEKYILYCADLNNCTNKEEVKKHNAAMKKLSVLYSKVTKEPDKSFLLRLLQNNNDRVKVIASAHCLGLNVYLDEAKKTLTRIANKNTNSFISFEAQSILDVWKKQGYLKF